MWGFLFGWDTFVVIHIWVECLLGDSYLGKMPLYGTVLG